MKNVCVVNSDFQKLVLLRVRGGGREGFNRRETVSHFTSL